MSSRFTVSDAQSPLRPKAGRWSGKSISLVAATAVAAAGIGGAVAASVGSAPAKGATSTLAATGHTGSTAFTVAPLGSHTSPAAAPAATDGHAAKAVKARPAALKHAPAAPGKPAPAPAKHDAPAPVKHAAAPAPARHAAAPAPVKHAAPAPVKHAAAPVKHAAAPVKHAAAPVKHAPAVHHTPPVPVKPYKIYDSVTPSQIPHGPQVATYANGAYAASASSVAGRGHVLWIDTNGSDTKASALDVEPGDATPAGAASWVQAKLNNNHKSVAIVYTMISQWQAVKDSVSALPHWMHSHVRYWIADPTGVQHVLPGANATQWYWGNNYDITTANPGFQS